jgi:hypothetical protein
VESHNDWDQAYLFRPGTLDQTRSQHLLPPVQALHIRPALQIVSDALPVATSVLGDGILQHFILLHRPLAARLTVQGTARGSQNVQVLLRGVKLAGYGYIYTYNTLGNWH